MQKYYLVLMLLVATFISIAHGRTLGINKDFMTSQQGKTDAVTEMDKRNLSLENLVIIRTPSSAVQDWSLVCQQLCGAALGGAVCAPYCKNLPILPFTVQLENAELILDSKKDLICPKLCGLQFGDDVCTCKDYNTNDIDADMKAEQETNVCDIICDHNGVTLAGCIPCKKTKNNRQIIFKNLDTFFEKQAVPIEDAASTTPNWTEICASLCKTGDGGSLCNCDLSPFMI